jgi:hypothetical protein
MIQPTHMVASGIAGRGGMGPRQCQEAGATSTPVIVPSGLTASASSKLTSPDSQSTRSCRPAVDSDRCPATAEMSTGAGPETPDVLILGSGPGAGGSVLGYRPELVRELALEPELLYFRRAGEREMVDNRPEPRRLEGGQPRTGIGEQGGRVEGVPGGGPDECGHLFSQRSSGMPTTAASATSGWPNSTASISRG